MVNGYLLEPYRCVLKWCIPKPNGFADQISRHEKWLAIIGKINPTFSDKSIHLHCQVVKKTHDFHHENGFPQPSVAPLGRKTAGLLGCPATIQTRCVESWFPSRRAGTWLPIMVTAWDQRWGDGFSWDFPMDWWHLQSFSWLVSMKIAGFFHVFSMEKPVSNFQHIHLDLGSFWQKDWMVGWISGSNFRSFETARNGKATRNHWNNWNNNINPVFFSCFHMFSCLKCFAIAHF